MFGFITCAMTYQSLAGGVSVQEEERGRWVACSGEHVEKVFGSVREGRRRRKKKECGLLHICSDVCLLSSRETDADR